MCVVALRLAAGASADISLAAAGAPGLPAIGALCTVVEAVSPHGDTP